MKSQTIKQAHHIIRFIRRYALRHKGRNLYFGIIDDALNFNRGLSLRVLRRFLIYNKWYCYRGVKFTLRPRYERSGTTIILPKINYRIVAEKDKSQKIGSNRTAYGGQPEISNQPTIL